MCFVFSKRFSFNVIILVCLASTFSSMHCWMVISWNYFSSSKSFWSENFPLTHSTSALCWSFRTTVHTIHTNIHTLIGRMSETDEEIVEEWNGRWKVTHNTPWKWKTSFKMNAFSLLQTLIQKIEWFYCSKLCNREKKFTWMIMAHSTVFVRASVWGH